MFYVYPFLHLVYPFATASFGWRSTPPRVHPPLYLFVKRYYILRVLRLMPCALQLFVRPGAPADDFTYSVTFNQYRFSKPAPQNCGVPPLRLSVSPGGIIPGAAITSGNFEPKRLVALSKQSCASFLFTPVTIIGVSSPLHYAIGSYPAQCGIESFTTSLLQRSMQLV